MKDTRNHIIESAIELFKERGYENTTIEAICKKTGITKGTFYYHFPNKDELTYAYYERLLENFIDIAPAIMFESNAKEQLWKILEYSIDNTISLSPELLKAFMISDITRGMNFFSPRKSSKGSRQREKQYELHIKIIEKGQQNGQIKQGNPHQMIKTYYAALIGTAIDWASNNGEFDEKTALRDSFDVIF